MSRAVDGTKRKNRRVKILKLAKGFRGDRKSNFKPAKDAVQKALQQIYGSIYTGYLGVDMLVYRDKQNGNLAIHPCIEINMRYTMGMVALRISERFLSPHARGDMHITYENKTGEAYKHHCFMKKAYPLEIVNGKIKEHSK